MDPQLQRSDRSPIQSPNDAHFIMGLDIGSSKICAVICELGAQGEVHIRGMGTSVSMGLNKGKIEDPDELFKAISRAVQKAQGEAGLRPKNMIVNVPPVNLAFRHNIGLVTSKELSGRISEEEKRESLRRSRNVVKSPDHTLVHLFPLHFKVDDAEVDNPVGREGIHLEVLSHLVLGDTDTLQKLTRLLKRMDFFIGGIVYDMMGTSHSVLTETERKEGVVLVDIGARFTKVAVFKNNMLHHSVVVPIGGDTLTQDIMYCLKVDHIEAERLKVMAGDVRIRRIDPQERIDIQTETGKKSITRLLLAQIIEARMAELLLMIQNAFPWEVDSHTKMVLSGGTSLLTGLSDYVQSTFNRPIRLGFTESLREVVEHPENMTALGLVLYAIKTNAVPYQKPQPIDPLSRFNRWVKEFFG